MILIEIHGCIGGADALEKKIAKSFLGKLYSKNVKIETTVTFVRDVNLNPVGSSQTYLRLICGPHASFDDIIRRLKTIGLPIQFIRADGMY